MKFTYYGHACFAVEAGGKKILFDPFITGNGLAKDIDINSIEADYILASHGHGDHVADLPAIAKSTGATVVAMPEVIGWAQKQGCEKVHPMNYGPYRFDFGLVRMVPACHSSSNPDGSYGGNPAGFVLETTDGNFYFAGDTCLITDMQLIPRFTKLDFAVLPVGGNYTMDAAEAVIAAEFVQCKKVVGVHFDTFPVIGIDHEAAKAAFRAAGCDLVLPETGKSMDV